MDEILHLKMGYATLEMKKTHDLFCAFLYLLYLCSQSIHLN